MSFGIVAGIIMFGWVFLCVFSGERERSFNDRKSRLESGKLTSLDTAKN
jgi:hypothetical protein